MVVQTRAGVGGWHRVGEEKVDGPQKDRRSRKCVGSWNTCCIRKHKGIFLRRGANRHSAERRDSWKGLHRWAPVCFQSLFLLACTSTRRQTEAQCSGSSKGPRSSPLTQALLSPWWNSADTHPKRLPEPWDSRAGGCLSHTQASECLGKGGSEPLTVFLCTESKA